MRRNSSKVTGRKTPQSRSQPGSSLMNSDSTGLMAGHADPPPGDERSFAQSLHLFSSGTLAFAQHISVEIVWTLLYLNRPMSSEKIAGRLLCNSATKCRGIERWFSQTIPEKSIYLAGLGTDTRRPRFLCIQFIWNEEYLLQANFIVVCILPVFSQT